MTAAKATPPPIQKIVRKLVRELAPQTIILFGSYVYGQPDESSDLDLLIVRDTDEPFFDRMRSAAAVVNSVAPHLGVDAIVRTPGELMQRLRVGDHFYQEILDRGLLLYGRSWREERCSIVVEDELVYPSEWLRIAEQDLRRVEVGLREDDPPMAGYYLQQALEKFLKAFLISRGWRLRRIHNLNDLLEQAATYEAGFSTYAPLCKTVNPWYTADRYPMSDEVPPTQEQAHAALESGAP